SRRPVNGSFETKKPDGHQRTDSAHLTLIFIMPAISQIGCDATISSFLHFPYPVLTQPGFSRMIENMRVGTTRLIGITHIPIIIGKYKIRRFCLHKSEVELST